MNIPKSWLVAAVMIALLYLLFPRYEMQIVSYSYPATPESKIPVPGSLAGIQPAYGTAVVFRLDRWTGKISWSRDGGNYLISLSDKMPSTKTP